MRGVADLYLPNNRPPLRRAASTSLPSPLLLIGTVADFAACEGECFGLVDFFHHFLAKAEFKSRFDIGFINLAKRPDTSSSSFLIKAKSMSNLALKVQRFLVSEDGPTAVEYAVMLALIIVVCLTAITAIGTNANATFQSVATKLAADVLVAYARCAFRRCLLPGANAYLHRAFSFLPVVRFPTATPAVRALLPFATAANAFFTPTLSATPWAVPRGLVGICLCSARGWCWPSIPRGLFVATVCR